MAPEIPPPPPRGENYSLDEMIHRLKTGKHEKNRDSTIEHKEIITKDDGTQVLRVKRRKRQPKNNKQTNPLQSPVLKWAIFGGLLALVIIVFASAIVIIAKYNGRQFKELTEAKITELTGSKKSSITKLRITPLSVKAEKSELSWGAYSFLKHAQFNHLSADIKTVSFLTKNWIGEEIIALTGSIHMQKPLSYVESVTSPLISPYHFNSYRCELFDVYFGEEKNAPVIAGLQISQRQVPDSNSYNFVFQDGMAKVENWPEVAISSGVLTLNEQTVEIEALLATGSQYNRGEITIEGEIPKTTQEPIVLAIKATDYPLQQLLGEYLTRNIQGTIQSGTGMLSYDYKKPSATGLSLNLPFKSTNIDLSNLPFLSVLRKITDDSKYSRVSFHNCHGNILRDSNSVSINQLLWVSSGLLTLQGDIKVTSDQQLSGTLNLSVPIFSFSGPAPKPFTGPNNGLYHISISLSGTVHNPHDNLGELIQQHSEKTTSPLPQQRGLTPQEQLEQEFHSLSQ